MSLREELFDIVYKTDLSWGADLTEETNKALDQILTTISKHLPEKQKAEGWTGKENNRGAWNSGYNVAIDEVNKLLTTQKGSDDGS